MISSLRGKIVDIEEKSMVIEVAGIGYQVWSTFECLETLRQKADTEEEVVLWVHHVVREDSEDIYGFSGKEERNFFELLISISGIGPKTALGVLSVASVQTIKQAVATGDATMLTKVAGIGKKNAEKIMLELRGKFDDEEFSSNMKDEIESIEALRALGFDSKAARDALKDIPKEVTETRDRIRHALKLLGK